MDKKIKLEIESLNEKISNMRKDIIFYEDIDGLKTKAEDKRSNLVKEKQSLLEEKEILLGEQEKVRKSLQDLQSQLDQNDSYIQLVNQEKRLAQIEQTNYTLDEFIKNKLSETNFIPVRDKCLERVQEYNALLKLSYQDTVHGYGTYNAWLKLSYQGIKIQ
uniref:Intraflagellar transport protein 74 homolog n=1 Tax=Cacopsylla melanoneura TaxID=428564 RepID=A0A8D8VIW2_9HEMI